MSRTSWLGTLVAVVVAAAIVGVGAAVPQGLPEQAKGKAKGLHKEEPCYVPYDLPAVPNDLQVVSRTELPGEGHGIWVDADRCLLYWTGDVDPAGPIHDHGLIIFDVTDPQKPVQLSLMSWGPLETNAGPRDVELLTIGTRHLAIVSLEGIADDGIMTDSGIGVIDVTDPTNPRILAEKKEHWSHNLGTYPGTPYVYSGTGKLLAGSLDLVIPILDVSDPENPVWHTTPIPRVVNGVPIQSDGCHDVTVRADLGRAFCAGGGSFFATGGGETFIWDVSDPLDPEWISMVDDPRIVYHHSAIASQDGRLIFVGDEAFFAPNCQPRMLGDQGYRHPTGAVWIYDITDPARPQQLGYVQVDGLGEPQPNNLLLQTFQEVNCGQHFGDIIEDTGFLAWGWYSGGTVLIDARDPRQPKVVDRERLEFEASLSNWDAKYFDGHVIAAGQGDGFPDGPYLTVFRLAGAP